MIKRDSMSAAVAATGHLVDITTASACKLNATSNYPPLASGGGAVGGPLTGASGLLGDDHSDPYLPRQPLADPQGKPAMPSRCSKNGAAATGLLVGGPPAMFGTSYVQPQNYENFRFNAFEAPLPPRK